MYNITSFTHHETVLHVLLQRNTMSVYFMDKIIIYLSIHLCFMQSVSGGIVNILGGGSMDYSE